MKKADLALYSAKADGAGTYRFFEPKMEAWAHRRRALEIGLRTALENGEIRLVFQPLVEMKSWRIAGCEALLRWTSPEWGVVSPAEFIPVAEATGLIEPIGEWVLREAVKTARQWPDDTVVAVNLSPVQFRNQKFLATVVAALADSGLPPNRLELEVTESIFLDRDGHVEAMLKNLRTLGVRTALDDFGTGYSSLSYLRRFPFDKIKIDKSFIDDVAARDDEPRDYPGDRRACRSARHVDDGGGRGIGRPGRQAARRRLYPNPRLRLFAAAPGARDHRHVRVEAGRARGWQRGSPRAGRRSARRVPKRRVTG